MSWGTGIGAMPSCVYGGAPQSAGSQLLYRYRIRYRYYNSRSTRRSSCCTACCPCHTIAGGRPCTRGWSPRTCHSSLRTYEAGQAVPVDASIGAAWRYRHEASSVQLQTLALHQEGQSTLLEITHAQHMVNVALKTPTALADGQASGHVGQQAHQATHRVRKEAFLGTTQHAHTCLDQTLPPNPACMCMSQAHNASRTAYTTALTGRYKALFS